MKPLFEKNRKEDRVAAQLTKIKSATTLGPQKKMQPLIKQPRAKRESGFKVGVIQFDNGQSTECIVRNLSDTGARLDLVGETTCLPPEATLKIPLALFSRKFRVVWFDNQEVGVAFLDELN